MTCGESESRRWVGRRRGWRAALRASPVPFVLMLDDLQELRSPACHDVLSVVISGMPRGSQLVAASRAEQPHLPRLRASGDALEFVASDLALDAAGAEQIFSQAHLSLTGELAAAVTARTEGWPVGLYLAAVIARASRGEVLTIAGDDRYVADYLYRESLMQLPEEFSGSCGGRRCWISCRLRCVTRSSTSRARGRGSGVWRRRTCSWCRWTAGGSGIATMRCSGSSCSVSFVGSSRGSSRSCICGPRTGMRPTDLRRWPSSICWPRPSGTGVSGWWPSWPCRPTRPVRCRRCSGGSPPSVTLRWSSIPRSRSWPDGSRC